MFGPKSMRYFLALLVLLVTAPVVSLPAWGYDDLVLPTAEFSAVAVQEAGNLRATEKVHYASGKLRIERAPGLTTTILDLATQTQYILMANHTYIVAPMDDELFRRFIARTAAMSGARRIGTEQVDGLKTTKYAFGNDGELNSAGTYWLSDTGIMVRRVYEEGVFGQNRHHREYLTDIVFGPQPARLFSIPAGYKRVK
jgi:hypothetical protein